MRTLRSVDELRAALAGVRRAERTIGLVPTMGAFHEGHLSLFRRARAECDEVVASLFVNPAQFRPGEDLDAYPRDEAGDALLAAEEGVDLLFAPPLEEVYPPAFATTVAVAGVTERLEGAVRGPEHFDGVTTVVAKLLNMVGPDVAYFGQKDAQQAAVIRRMVADLNFPVRIEICPTAREADGLALSSRNAYLDDGDRARAVALRRALDAAEAAVAAGERETARIVEAARGAMAELDVDPDYVEVVAPDTFSPLERIDASALVAVAARVGPTRLIDNTLLSTNHKDPH
jgi:pantoate--beta-alanine ligase